MSNLKERIRLAEASIRHNLDIIRCVICFGDHVWELPSSQASLSFGQSRSLVSDTSAKRIDRESLRQKTVTNKGNIACGMRQLHVRY